MSCPIIGNGLAIVGKELVLPHTVVDVGVHRAVYGLRQDIATFVIGVGIGSGGAVSVVLHCLRDFSEVIVGIGFRPVSLICNLGDVAPAIIVVSKPGHRTAGAAELVGIGIHQGCGFGSSG